MNSPMLPTIVWLGLRHKKKLLLGIKSPRKELWRDEFFVAELVPLGTTLDREKKEVGIGKNKKDAKV